MIKLSILKVGGHEKPVKIGPTPWDPVRQQSVPCIMMCVVSSVVSSVVAVVSVF